MAVTAPGSRLGRTLAAFVTDNAPAVRCSSVLIVGVSHLELLEAASSVATSCHAVASTRRGAQAAEAFAGSRGLPCQVRAADAINALQSEGDLEAVILECLAAPGSALAPLLTVTRKALSTRGRLWLFTRYEALQEGPRRGVDRGQRAELNPLASIRRLLSAAGLTCELLSPIEADGEHVLGICAARAVILARATPSLAGALS